MLNKSLLPVPVVRESVKNGIFNGQADRKLKVKVKVKEMVKYQVKNHGKIFVSQHLLQIIIYMQ